MSYLLRVTIALDQLIQAMFRSGKPGVTISSRVGTACAHGHAWGKWANRFLECALGPRHCKNACLNDIKRAKAAIKELRDPVVTEWIKSS